MVRNFKLCLAWAAALLLQIPTADAATVKYGSRHVALAPSFATPMQCVLDQLRTNGYLPRSVGCYGYRPKNRSAHPTGHACDVDQTGRNLTSLNRFMSSASQRSLAESCRAVSGCKWRHPDCGHFEARSAPYSRSGALPVSHYYGERYASHPVVRRRYN